MASLRQKCPWGALSVVGYTGRLPPERGAFFTLAVCLRVGKNAILVTKGLHNQLQSGRSGG